MIILIYLYLGATSLHIAAIHGHTDTVKMLIYHGANVSTKDYDGKKDNTYTCIYILFISSNYSQDSF